MEYMTLLKDAANTIETYGHVPRCKINHNISKIETVKNKSHYFENWNGAKISHNILKIETNIFFDDQ